MDRRTVLGLVLLATAALFTGARCGEERTPCNLGSDCPLDGQYYECVEGFCEPPPCENSNDCPIGLHCGLFIGPDEELSDVLEQGRGHTCIAGCRGDNDCLSIEFCDEGACKPRPCRNGHLDCGFCQFCDPVTKSCVPSGEPYCIGCFDFETIIDPGDPMDPCDQQAIGHPVCGPGNACWPYSDERTCAVACDSNSECPGGMVCTDLLVSAPGCFLDITSIGRFCLGDCQGTTACTQ